MAGAAAIRLAAAYVELQARGQEAVKQALEATESTATSVAQQIQGALDALEVPEAKLERYQGHLDTLGQVANVLKNNFGGLSTNADAAFESIGNIAEIDLTRPVEAISIMAVESVKLGQAISGSAQAWEEFEASLERSREQAEQARESNQKLFDDRLAQAKAIEDATERQVALEKLLADARRDAEIGQQQVGQADQRLDRQTRARLPGFGFSGQAEDQRRRENVDILQQRSDRLNQNRQRAFDAVQENTKKQVSIMEQERNANRTLRNAQIKFFRNTGVV